MIAMNGLALAAPGEPPDPPDFPSGCECRRPRGAWPDPTALLSLLKTDAEAFRAETQSGKTLLDIAAAHGVSEKVLQQFLKQQLLQQIENDEEEGRLPPGRAEKMKSDLDEHIQRIINSNVPGHHHAPPRRDRPGEDDRIDRQR
ncbi:MAG: hypothetical protein E6X17_04820 [Sporomusaceae bacterium]|nr:hypothetical protein [Sporomusaceae bacterium]